MFFLLDLLPVFGVGLLLLGLTQQFGVYWSGGAADTINTRPDVTGDTSIESEFSIAGAQTDQEQQIGFDVANLKGIVITVDGNDTTVVTMETNNGTTPDDTFTFPIGGGEFLWSNRSPIANPFTADVTTMFFTHAGTETVTVNFRILLNA